MGGAIVTLSVLSCLDGVHGFALSAPGLKVTDDVTRKQIRAVTFLAKIVPKAHVYNIRNADFSRDSTVVEDMDRDPLIDQRSLPARTALEFLGAMIQIQDRAHEISIPFLAMHGTGDRLTNPQESQDLCRNASSSDKMLKPHPGLYHNPLHEPEEATVIGDLLAWSELHTNGK